jgi:DNA primase small subunit
MPLNSSDVELYFQKIFPTKQFCNWLSYGDVPYLKNREFSFTLPGDIYLRFRSFDSWQELQKDLVRKKPEKIDIGGIYNVPPKQKDASAIFQAREKEVVFDIDISDYDDVRVCCKDKRICTKCWPLMSCAVQVLNHILKEDFGYENLMFVFSGRRGVHCWVSDRLARKLTDEERTALANYINVYEGGEGQRINIEHQLRRNSLHPSLEAIYQNFLKPGFRDMFLSETLNPENSIDQAPTAELIMNLIAKHIKNLTDADAKALNKIFVDGNKSCEDRWKGVQKFCSSLKAPWIPKYIEFFTMYPRLDINVSKQCNHLLKAPFVIHPGTGNICVPLTADTVADFDPNTCPKLTEVLHDYEKGVFTLEPIFDAFAVFVDRCIMDAQAPDADVEANDRKTA